MGDKTKFFQQLEAMQEEARWDLLKDLLIQSLREILFVPEGKKIEDDKGFFDLGLDSITAMQLRARLKKDLGDDLKLETTKVFDYPTVNELAKYLTTIISVKITIPKELQEGIKSETTGKDIKKEVEELSDEELFRQLTEETDKDKNG